MLTYDDEPTIRNAIMKRLGNERGVKIADIEVKDFPDAKPPHMQVGIWLVLLDRIDTAGLIDVRSFFDLPEGCEHSHLVNEIDEVAEQLKVVRRQTIVGKSIFNPFRRLIRHAVSGTGFRGRWPEATREPAKAGLLAK